MPISFNEISSNLLTPGAVLEIDNSRAVPGQANLPQKLLVIGQKLTIGTASEATLLRIFNSKMADDYFGVGSILALMLKTVLKNTQGIQLFATALNDAGGAAAASSTITVTGPASANGTIALYINDKKINVPILNGDSANTIATTINTRLSTDPELPVTASVAANVVTVTAKNKGTLGNQMVISHSFLGKAGGEELPAGVSVAITTMSGGATDPDLATAIAALTDETFDHIVHPYTDATSLAAMKTEMDSRWSAARMLYGHTYGAKKDTLSNLSTFVSALNNRNQTILGFTGSLTPSWIWASAYAGQCAWSLSIDPARPLQTLSLVGVLAPKPEDRFTLEEQNVLLSLGMATFTVDDDGTVRIQRAVTTYKKNASNVPDPSYRDTETMATLQRLAQEVRIRIAQKFPRMKLAPNGSRIGFGQALVTPNDVRAELVALFSEWEERGLVHDFTQFKQDLRVEINVDDPNRLDVLLPPNLVNQLRITAIQLQFRL
jgi:phage tail sheath gpL-like